MKRLICALMIICLFLSMAGCSISGSRFKEPVRFYYPRHKSGYLYGEADSVIVAEEREAAGHTGHLEYLLTMYLSGSLDEMLASPFPAGTKLLSVAWDESTLLIELSEPSHAMTEHEFSLGCTCLTLTCLELTDATEVTVTSADRSVTMGREDVTLYDDVFVEPEE